MSKAFTIATGDQPTLRDVISDDDGAVDLSGSSVKFVFQGPNVSLEKDATITDASAGKVEYQFADGETDVAGDYIAQWRVTDGTGAVRNFPGLPFEFSIVQGVPRSEPEEFAKLSDLYDDIRAVAGDFSKRLYEDSAIAMVMRTHLRRGAVRDDDAGKVWKLSSDGFGISPVITADDTLAYALLVYHSAHSLVLPNTAAYQYRTRALSERFGEQKDFLFNLQNALNELENGSMVWANVSGLRNWLLAINGIWVWSYVQAEQNIDLSFH